MNKRLVIILLISLVVVSTNMFASSTRMSGLGNPYGLILDDTDVFMYPATISQYSGTVVGELGTGDESLWQLNANIPVLEYNLGVYLNQDTGMDLIDYFNYDLMGDPDTQLDISKSTNFLFGINDGLAIGFGTSVDYLAEFEIIENGNTKDFEPTASYYTLFGGFSNEKIDTGMKLEFAGAEEIVNGISKTEFSTLKLTLNQRSTIINEDRLELIGQASFMYESIEINSSNVATGNDEVDLEASAFALDFGFGLQVKANKNNKIIFGIVPLRCNPATVEETFHNGNNKITETEDHNLILFPEYKLGVESKICSWLTGRLGACQTYNHVTDESDDGIDGTDNTEEKYYEKAYNMNLGLTFKFGKFCVDSVLENEILHDGPNFIGGKDNGLASQVSVKYNF